MNVRLKYNTDFVAAVYYEDDLRMTNYDLCLKLVTGTLAPEEHNIALERLKYFIQVELDSTIFINASNEDQCGLFDYAGLKFTTLPEEPIDQIVGIVLFSKFNAIMEGRLIVTELEISSALGENIIYLHSAAEDAGPFAANGWWNSATPEHCDYVDAEEENVVEVISANQWRELDLHWPDPEASTKDNTVVFAKFKRDETK